MSHAAPESSTPDAPSSALALAPGSAPWDATTCRLVERLNADLVVISAPRIHRRPQLFVRVKTRKAGWCRVTATQLPKGSDAFAPLRRAAAYCYIDGAAVTAAKVGEYLKPNTKIRDGEDGAPHSP